MRGGGGGGDACVQIPILKKIFLFEDWDFFQNWEKRSLNSIEDTKKYFFLKIGIFFKIGKKGH